MYFVEYSVEQGCFHVESAAEAFRSNARAALDGRQLSYLPIAASQYCQPEITICEECLHRDVCGDRDYLTENSCCDFWGWVSVNARLPDDGERVLMCLGSVNVMEGYCGGEIWFRSESWNVEEAFGCKVTHWMPLPEPPKEETDG